MKLREHYATRIAGYSLVEVAVAIPILALGILMFGGVVISTGSQTEQGSSRQKVLAASQNLVEELKGVAVSTIPETYDAKTYSVGGVTGTNADGSVITVDVDSTNPSLLVVNVTANWEARGINHNLVLRTELYSPKS